MGTRPILQVLKMFQLFFPVPVQVQCERFLLKPYNPFFLVPVPVPVPVPDQASVNTPLPGGNGKCFVSTTSLKELHVIQTNVTLHLD